MWAKLFLSPRFINRVHLTWSHRSLITMQLETKEFESLFTDGLVGLAGKLTLSYAIITLSFFSFLFFNCSGGTVMISPLYHSHLDIQY